MNRDADAAQLSGNENILLVDDEPALLVMGKHLLEMERLGYRVETQADPLAALERFRAAPHSFELMITGMAMPRMTGDKLAREVKTIRPDMTIILCTDFSEKIDGETAPETGIDKYIEKPLNREEIGRAIREVLTAYSGRRIATPTG